MKISDVLLATMLISAFGSEAQDSTKIKKQGVVLIPQNTALRDSAQTVEISLITKYIDSLYTNRALNNKAPQTNKNSPKVRPRPYYYCPGCGRG